MTQKKNCYSETVQLQRCPNLVLKTSIAKGRGVFASANIPAGTILDICPVLILGIIENIEHVEQTQLYHYTYNWPTKDSNGEPRTSQAVVFGLGSMFNHSTQRQNVGWKRDVERQVITYRSLTDVEEGEELCISYGDHLTFVDADGPGSPVPAEVPEEMLGKIEINGD